MPNQKPERRHEGPSAQRPEAGAEGLSPEDLSAEQSTDLPDREAMSTIDIGLGFPIDNFAMPINEATAVNINTNYSIASADADQVVIIDQGATDTN